MIRFVADFINYVKAFSGPIKDTIDESILARSLAMALSQEIMIPFRLEDTILLDKMTKEKAVEQLRLVTLFAFDGLFKIF